ncbi:AbrB family transcriptional regulator [Bosea rubneri]|uniref:AbrB family transcriptional regulator n=1 Tax=Bosea rubneri TaxID=3075434 RepID=A0ABU3SGJ0_9HYPH|nr:AbrB family transcriptional regulator [Bosea sp. ZW T0_25]MDU0343806.1 AbrB family transcriptional regulator [Bosea sp. ZW T0_25]
MRDLLADMANGVRELSPRRFPWRRFLLALSLGILGGWLFAYLRLPLPWMLGSMVFCTAAAISRAPVAAPPVIRPPMSAVIGVMLGSGFRPDLIAQLPNWLPTLAGLVLFMAACAFFCVGYFRRVAGYDPVTAFFAGMPGGLVEMVITGEEKGGDARTIALIHSARILLVVMTLPFIVQWLEGVSLGINRTSGPSMMQTSALGWFWLVACGVLGVMLAHALRLPAKQLLGPMLVSAAVHVAGLSDSVPPFEIVNLAQLILGVTIGCRFVGTPPQAILRILVISAGSTLILLALTLAFAFAVAQVSRYQPVPLILAYSPGGLAEMSLIALALHTEVAFVAAHHIIRVFLVMIGAGPLFGVLGGKPKSASKPK